MFRLPALQQDQNVSRAGCRGAEASVKVIDAKRYAPVNRGYVTLRDLGNLRMPDVT